jgi:hypothetical protein
MGIESLKKLCLKSLNTTAVSAAKHTRKFRERRHDVLFWDQMQRSEVVWVTLTQDTQNGELFLKIQYGQFKN